MNEKPSTSEFFLLRFMHTFAHVITGSVTDLNYYVSVLNTPFRFSLKVIASFYMVLGLLLSVGFTLVELPQLSQNLDAARAELVEKYPSDLSLDWDGEKLSSTWETFQVPYPSSFSPLETAPKNLAEVNTATTDGPTNSNALIYINQKNMYINSLQGNWSDSPILNLVGGEPQHVGRDEILKFAESSKTVQQDFLMSLPFLALLYFTIGTLFLRMLMIVFNALIVQFSFQLMNKPLSYKKVYQLSLHILIPTELIHQISFLLAPKLEIPMFSLAFWMIVALLIWHLRNLKVLQIEMKKETNEHR